MLFYLGTYRVALSTRIRGFLLHPPDLIRPKTIYNYEKYRSQKYLYIVSHIRRTVEHMCVVKGWGLWTWTLDQ